MVQEIDSVEAFDKLSSDNKFVVVDFSATWCGPCRKLAPIYNKVAEEGREGVAFVKVDIDECDDLAERFKIRKLPTIMVVKDGDALDHRIGSQTEETLKLFIDEVVLKNTETQLDDDF